MLKIIQPIIQYHKCEFPYIFKDRLYPIHEICEKYKEANETIISYKWKNVANCTKILCVIKIGGPVVIIFYYKPNTNLQSESRPDYLEIDKIKIHESISYENIESAKLALDSIFNI